MINSKHNNILYDDTCSILIDTSIKIIELNDS